MDKCWWINVKRKSEIKWSLSLSAFHKPWLLTILSADLILFNLFVSLQPLTRPFLMEHQNEDFFSCLSLLNLSLYLSPLLLVSLYFFSPSLSLCCVGVRVICVLHGNFRGIGMVWLEQVITQLVCLSFLPSSTHVFLFFAFPVNHSWVVLTEINRCI